MGRVSRAIGVWLAQTILVLTGNFALAASLRALPSRFWLPMRLTAVGTEIRIEFVAGELEWARFLHREDQTKRVHQLPEQSAAIQSGFQS